MLKTVLVTVRFDDFSQRCISTMTWSLFFTVHSSWNKPVLFYQKSFSKPDEQGCFQATVLDDHLHVLRSIHFCQSSQADEMRTTSKSCFSTIFLAYEVCGERYSVIICNVQFKYWASVPSFLAETHKNERNKNPQAPDPYIPRDKCVKWKKKKKEMQHPANFEETWGLASVIQCSRHQNFLRTW